MREFFLVASALSMLLTVARSGPSDFIRIEIPGTGVALNLPTDWVPIPLQVIERYRNAMASSSKGPAEAKRAMNYVYGAQRKAEDYFEYPYLLVQILDTGRISEAQLKCLPNNGLSKGLAVGGKQWRDGSQGFSKEPNSLRRYTIQQQNAFGLPFLPQWPGLGLFTGCRQ
jgi:hypothetical protein